MAQTPKDGKKYLFGKEARQAILDGSKVVYDAVMTTYGPKGRNVLLEKTYGRPVITRDGVTVARESYLEDRGPNMGSQLVIEASQTTNRVAGDGTSCTVGLTYQLIKLGMQKIEAGVNPMDVKAEIMEDSYKILDKLAELSKDVKKGQLEQVATVSSGDPLLGQLIAEAVEEVGNDGGLITEKALISGVDRTYINGYFLQQGFTALTEGKKEIEEPYIVVSSKPVTSRFDAIQILNRVGDRARVDQGLPLSTGGQPVPLKEPLRVSFFGEFDGEAYNVLVANINQGFFDGTITKTPPMGELGAQYLDDIAVYCGGKPITAGESLTTVDGTYVGRAEKVTATTTETTIFGGQFNQEDLDKRIADIKDRIKTESLDAMVEKLKDRLAKLENKIALFRIGGATETEREEKEYRIEDAIQATKAAAQHGVVVGGGITLIKLSQTKDIHEIFQTALRNVFKKLITNAGLEGEVKLNEALQAPAGYGFNLREGGEPVDLVDEGVLDPTLVIEQVVENAASTAANAVSVGALITFVDKAE